MFQQALIKSGEVASIDPRWVDHSFAEAKLAEVIERCFVYEPDKRADINELQQMLEAAIAEDEKLQAKKSQEEQKRKVDKTKAQQGKAEENAAAAVKGDNPPKP